MLGKRIHQIHVKNADMLLSTPGGRLDWPRMAQEFYDIGYRGWYVLETGSPIEGHRRRHARQHRVREEDVPHAAGAVSRAAKAGLDGYCFCSSRPIRFQMFLHGLFEA